MVTNPNSSPSTIVGYFSNRAEAERAVSDLKDAGFASNQIGITTRSSYTAADSGNTPYVEGKQPSNAAGTVRGTAENVGEKVRGTWDKVVDFFEGKNRDRTHDQINDQINEPYQNRESRTDYGVETGIAPRSSTTPAEITTETTASSDTSPSIAYEDSNPYDYDYEGEEFEGSLNELKVPQERSRYFRHQFDRNAESTIVTVSAHGRENEAETILKRNGADLGSNAADYNYSSAETSAQDNYPQRIQLLGEALRVHKHRISRGDVRLRKQVVSDVQTIQVPVTREELVIERSEGTQAPIEAQFGDSGEIRVPLSEEKVTLEKQPYVREEVSVGKRTVSDVQQFEERVRREELKVDDERENRTA